MFPPPTLTDRFAAIVRTLRLAIAARAVHSPAAIPVLLLAWARLGRMVVRFQTLLHRVQSGSLPARSSTPRPRSRAPRPAQPRLPRGRHWLVRLVPEAASAASQLQSLLAEPEVAALLQAAPQTGRILRPLCRLLAIPPGPAAPPPRPTPRCKRQPTPPSGYPLGQRPPRTLSHRICALAGIPPPRSRRRRA